MSFNVDDVLQVITDKHETSKKTNNINHDEPFNNVMNDISQNWDATNKSYKAEIIKLKNENAKLHRLNSNNKNKIQELQDQIFNLKTTNSDNKLTQDNDLLKVATNKELQGVGVIKTFNAIKKEIEIQKIDEVAINRRTLENKYFVNPAQITPALRSLKQHGFIEIIKKSERKRTFQIIKDLPFIKN